MPWILNSHSQGVEDVDQESLDESGGLDSKQSKNLGSCEDPKTSNVADAGRERQGSEVEKPVRDMHVM